ncbi:CheY FOG, CheY-like receiver [uncultured Caudovirales phage]|uniref:CheY FOG, CheY-like receiver n=2 Tax=root TaxID=1 RepID=A0A6J5QSU8_9CAUD|nr:CheY FOG, CheY-like receiver [uncultured Caudovirales phage]CAB4171208.1 CheY FOG, CheY-like receiver [uncultured Caudovirales phage]CAB4177216.1 CheY FOG, CheY-like receiver [uncultured Caudovirales phage]CAB4182554.1 CheY FOG, CheY-like receiver [uncultured Caudovirales phage]CAB4187375.1 CheY FOG, CheY-like receiver [uncultured Caudovirales phage]
MRLRILLIHESSRMRKLLRAKLYEAALDNDVLEADSRQSALRKLTNDVKFIIAPSSMPSVGMEDGVFDMIRHLRSWGKDRPILMLTTKQQMDEDPHLILKMAESGATDFMVIPFDARAIKLKIQCLMGVFKEEG